MERKNKQMRIKVDSIGAMFLGIVFALLTSLPSQSQIVQAGPQSPLAQITDALRNHDFEKALELIYVALQKAPRDYRLWTLRGLAYADANKLALAQSAYDRALKLSPEYLPALEGSAQIEYAQGSGKAKTSLEHLLTLRPGDTTAHAMLAVIEYRAHNCSAAVDHFAQAGPTVETQPETLSEYGICLAKLDRFDEAIVILQKIVSLQPENKGARYNLALAQWDAQHDEDALKTLQPLIESRAADEDVLALAADIYESANDTPHAVELLRKAILEDPKNPDAYLRFATLSYNHVSYKVGIDMLDLGLTQLPRDARLYIARGVLYTQLGEFDKGLTDFETANRIDPKQQFAGTAEGLVASQQSKFAEAIERFRLQAKQDPKNGFTHYLLAEALSNEGKSEEYQEAVDAAMQAVKLDPGLVAAHDLLAMLYLQSGKSELAAIECQSALDLDPKDQQALYHLVLAIRKTGRKSEIPVLMKRLADMRDADQTQGAQQKRYKLMEVPATPTQEASH